MESAKTAPTNLHALDVPKVLITDDDEATRILLRVAIAPWGYKVVEAKDGEEAWEILQQPDPPSILILDWVMPRLDGIGLCKRIEEKLAYRPYIIFVTRMSSAENVIQGFEAGADEFILKPFDLAELRIRIFAGERIIKYRNQVTEQHKQIQAYMTNMQELAKDYAKTMFPYADFMNILQDAHHSLAGINDELRGNQEKNATAIAKIQELQSKSS